ncbi:MAG TPA: MFS transporter [Caulobacterales bacterium]|jgi:PAT family beta-lactamase induction signal transducer AmpG|nr:MFS transporter [Caulobacterales bacterium]
MAEAAAKPKKLGFKAVLASLSQPRVVGMLALGFSSGLPFMLSAGTLGYWLRDEGTTLTAIGFASWVGIAYSMKFLWAPLIDRLPPPLLGAMGRRRGWIALTQIVLAATLFAMAATGPHGPAGIGGLVALALALAIASSTQDIVIDAWRIEAAADKDELGLLSAAGQLGYRAALLCADALILIFAQHLGWQLSYSIMALLMLAGLAATFLVVSEPEQADATLREKSTAAPIWTPRGFADAVAGPFIAFFKTHGMLALLMLAMISLYQLPNFMMGPMLTPFYHDLGLAKDQVGIIRTTIGLPASLLGIAAGGVFTLRFGYIRGLIAGIILEAIATGIFAWPAFVGPGNNVFAIVMAIDSFGLSFAGVALVTYMSSLTTLGYTATQYAILSSTYVLAGKFLKGFSGKIVDTLAQSHDQMTAYGLFFLYAASIGVPVLALCLMLSARQAKTGVAATSPA